MTSSEPQSWVTGKVVMEVVEDADKDRFLSVIVELAPGEVESEGDRKF